MARFKRTLIQYVEITPSESSPDASMDLDDIRDAFSDDILNSQNVEHETDDNSYMYIPQELLLFKLEPVE